MTTMISRPARGWSKPNTCSPDATNSRSTKSAATPMSAASSGSDSPAANERAAPEPCSPQGTKTAGGQWPFDAQRRPAAGSDVPDPAANVEPMTIRRSLLDPALSLAADILDDLERVRIANENRLRQLTRSVEDKDGEVRGLGYDESHPDVARLSAMVDMLKKLEHDATLNLNRHMRRHPLGAWVKAQKGIGEKQGARLLAAVGDPYIRPELLNEDGSVKSKEGPRTVSALWAYCGLHVLPGSQSPYGAQTGTAAGDQHRDTDQKRSADQNLLVGVAAKRRKGERANWSGKAKMRAYLIAESCIKQLDPQCKAGQRSSDTHEGTAGPALRRISRDGHVPSDALGAGAAVPARDPQDRGGQTPDDAHTRSAAPACSCSTYRIDYDHRRAHTAATHPEWTPGHSHNDALRVASKEILKDLWRAAREWHLSNGDKK